MNVTTCTDQAQCRAVLRELCCEEVFRPVPPIPVCDGIVQLDDNLWLVGTNDREFLTLHVLEECTQVEAWEFFNGLRGPSNTYINPRITVCGPAAVNPQNN